MLGFGAPTSPLQPLEMIARTLDRTTAITTVSISFWGFSTTILPKPMYTGGGPACRNSDSSEGGLYDGGSRKKNPHTSVVVRAVGLSARQRG